MSELTYLFFDSELDANGEMRFTRHVPHHVVLNGAAVCLPKLPDLPSFEPWNCDPVLTCFYEPNPVVWEPKEVKRCH